MSRQTGDVHVLDPHLPAHAGVLARRAGTAGDHLRRAGALVPPFMAATLLYLLNSKQISNAFRNQVMGNIVLGVSVLLFIAIAVVEIKDLF
jgi:hypothetical protein